MTGDPDVQLQQGDMDVLIQIAEGPADGLLNGELRDRAGGTRLWQRGYVHREAGRNRVTPAGMDAYAREIARRAVEKRL